MESVSRQAHNSKEPKGYVKLDGELRIVSVSGLARSFFRSGQIEGSFCLDASLDFARPALNHALKGHSDELHAPLYKSPKGILFRFAASGGQQAKRLDLYTYQLAEESSADGWQDDSERLSLLMKATQSGVYDRDLENNRVWRNDAFYRLVGHDPANADESTDWWWKLIAPKDLTRVEQYLKQVMEDQDTLFRVEYRAKAIDGQYKYLLDKGHIEYNTQGKACRITGVITDISPKKEAERHLVESEVRFKGVFEHAGVGMLRINLIGDILEPNAFFQEMLGYSLIELSGRPLSSFLMAEDRRAYRQSLKRSVKAKSPSLTEKEFRMLHKIGRIVWVKINISFIWGDARLPAYGIAMVEDISEKKLAEEKVRESQERIETINNNIDDGIFRSAMDQGVVYANQAFVDMLGYGSVAELRETATLNLYKDPSQQRYLLKKLEKQGFLRNEEVLLQRKDGSSFWALFNCTSSIKEGGRTFFDGAIADITEQKRSRELLERQNQELEKINQELDRFVYSASHDLRAPLTSLLGLLEIIRGTKNPDELNQFLDMMQQSIAKLDLFIRDIVNYSRNTRTEVQKEEIDLKELISDIFEGLQHTPEAQQVKMQIEAHQEEAFISDRHRLTPVFSNLISNALRYHNFFQSAPFIKVKIEVDAQQAVIRIQDNGQGIRGEHIDHIFDMFYRASDSAKGSGLGLYIVKETVEKLGGVVSVVSKVDKGSTFTVVLPNSD